MCFRAKLTVVAIDVCIRGCGGATAVPKSLREIVCPRPSADAVVWACSDKLNSSELYRLFVALFGLLLGPFTFGHVHKTRALQLVSTLVRHASFGLMIVLASIGVARGHGRSVADVMSYEQPSNIATFFGVCIYSFMCHHRYASRLSCCCFGSTSTPEN